MTWVTTSLATTVAASAVLTLAGPAQAEPVDDSTPEQDGGQEGQTIHAAVQFDESNNGSGPSVGPLTTTSSTWSPPPCWYEPTWDPAGLREHAEEHWDLTGQQGHAAAALGWMWDHYDEGNPYTNFNAERAGDGMWWAGEENPNEPDVLARGSCSDIPFWVEFGEVPDVENALSPEILAELAYERIRVPDTEITLSPEELDGQVVNLPTWIWSDGGDFRPVSVTASLDGWDMWATTTATPVSMTIDAGTEDAELHPSSGECSINEDGSIGQPYTEGRDDETPPCGVTYGRATHDTDAYELTASITWEIAWEGSGGTGDTLPDAVFETTYDVQVQEVQSIVR
jgi:enoyl reductase